MYLEAPRVPQSQTLGHMSDELMRVKNKRTKKIRVLLSPMYNLQQAMSLGLDFNVGMKFDRLELNTDRNH